MHTSCKKGKENHQTLATKRGPIGPIVYNEVTPCKC